MEPGPAAPPVNPKLSTFRLVLVRPDDILRGRDRIVRPAAVVDARPAAVPLLRITGAIALEHPFVEVRITACAAHAIGEREHELSGVTDAVCRV